MAASDVTAEYRLNEDTIATLLADLERKGSAGYQATIPMIDAGGVRLLKCFTYWVSQKGENLKNLPN